MEAARRRSSGAGGAAGAGGVGGGGTGAGGATGAVGAGGAEGAGGVVGTEGGEGARARLRFRGLLSTHSSSSSFRESPRRRGCGEGERGGTKRTSRSTGASGFICFSW